MQPIPPIAIAHVEVALAQAVARLRGDGLAARLARAALALAAVALVALAAYAFAHAGHLDALQNMTQKTIAPRFDFGGIGSYIDNIRDALIPLAIPIGGCALVGVGFLLFTGNPRAYQIGGGVFGGLGLVFFAPNILN
ncbi:MAG TPA: hypothetical protein VGM91_19270 [Conexibacter sp.]|jgi:opacity protein-like surface antigen